MSRLHGLSIREEEEMGQKERLFTPAEVGALFRVHPRTATRWGTSGRLASIRTPGGHRRFPESAVMALFNQMHSAEAVAS
jgi:excisionase family DNA binding protein